MFLNESHCIYHIRKIYISNHLIASFTNIPAYIYKDYNFHLKTRMTIVSIVPFGVTSWFLSCLSVGNRANLITDVCAQLTVIRFCYFRFCLLFIYCSQDCPLRWRLWQSMISYLRLYTRSVQKVSGHII